MGIEHAQIEALTETYIYWQSNDQIIIYLLLWVGDSNNKLERVRSALYAFIALLTKSLKVLVQIKLCIQIKNVNKS